MFTGEDFIRTMGAAVREAQQDLLDHGLPICYQDETGNVVLRFPDGRIEIVKPAEPENMLTGE